MALRRGLRPCLFGMGGTLNKLSSEIGFNIGTRKVGAGQPVFVVVDVAQAHDGSLGTAHAFIDAVANARADAVKFQTHIAAAESTLDEPFRVKFSRQDKNRYDYWKRMEFTAGQWRGLADHAREKGLEFLSTPFSIEAADLLEEIGMPAWKVGSGEVANPVLLERLLASGKPMLLSSGMSSWIELDAAVETIKKANVPCMVYQCTTQYPCAPENVGLGLIPLMEERYATPVGLSDHSGNPVFGIAAAALGAASVEVHITMSRHCFGPDVPASLTPEDLFRMVEGIRAVEASLNQTPDKDRIAESCADIRKMFGRGIVTRISVKKGEVITAKHLTVKKPAKGLPPSAMGKLLGRLVLKDLPADHFIQEEDLA